MRQTTKSQRTIRIAGFTLVELMVSLLIVGIVMMGWWRIMNATSPYREAQRRAAVEVAAGMLDIFPSTAVLSGTYCEIDLSGVITPHGMTPSRFPFPAGCLPADSPIRYSLNIVSVPPSAASNWRKWVRTSGTSTSRGRWWATIKLYDGEDVSACPSPFATFEQLIYTK